LYGGATPMHVYYFSCYVCVCDNYQLYSTLHIHLLCVIGLSFDVRQFQSCKCLLSSHGQRNSLHLDSRQF